MVGLGHLFLLGEGRLRWPPFYLAPNPRNTHLGEVSWGLWVGYLLVGIGGLGGPIAIGIAILRYRLYEIDTLINRTLVYGALSASLALVYFGGVAATGAIFRALTGQERQPQLAVVVSTLEI